MIKFDENRKRSKQNQFVKVKIVLL